MNYITYTFRDEKGTEYELVENNDLTGIEINNEFMEARCKKCGINKLTSCTMKLGVANVAVFLTLVHISVYYRQKESVLVFLGKRLNTCNWIVKTR